MRFLEQPSIVPFRLLDFAASLKALSHLPPGHWIGTDCGHLFIFILVSVGESPIQLSHGEFDKGKEIKTGERDSVENQYGGCSIHTGNSSARNPGDEGSRGRAPLSLGGLSLRSREGHVSEGRRVDLEPGIQWSCCGELNLLALFCLNLGVAEAFQKQHLGQLESEDGKKGNWGL